MVVTFSQDLRKFGHFPKIFLRSSEEVLKIGPLYPCSCRSRTALMRTDQQRGSNRRHTCTAVQVSVNHPSRRVQHPLLTVTAHPSGRTSKEPVTLTLPVRRAQVRVFARRGRSLKPPCSYRRDGSELNEIELELLESLHDITTEIFPLR